MPERTSYNFAGLITLTALIAVTPLLTAWNTGSEENTMATVTSIKRLTPVLMVDEIEPSLPFWVDRLGFEKTAEVPEGDKLGFVILKRGEVEVMLQSRAGQLKDNAALAAGPFAKDGVMLFIEITGFDEWLPKLEGLEVVVPERNTFYGSREIGVRAPSGIIVVLAEFAEQPAGN